MVPSRKPLTRARNAFLRTFLLQAMEVIVPKAPLTIRSSDVEPVVNIDQHPGRGRDNI
jgi:hypothetical protein